MHRSRTSFGVLALVAGLFVGCATTARPDSELSRARASVRAAEGAGAKGHAQSELHLKYARAQLARAEAMMADDEHAQAALLLEQARVDAELALALTRARTVEVQAQQAVQRVDELQRRVK